MMLLWLLGCPIGGCEDVEEAKLPEQGGTYLADPEQAADFYSALGADTDILVEYDPDGKVVISFVREGQFVEMTGFAP